MDKPFRNSQFMRKLTEGWQIKGSRRSNPALPPQSFSNDNQSQQASGLDRADGGGKRQTFNARTIQTFTPDPNGIKRNCLNGETTEISISSPGLPIAPMSPKGAGIPLFSFGDSGRNSVRRPGINNVDLSIFRTSNLTRRSALEFSVRNSFNAFQSHPVPAFGELVNRVRIYREFRARCRRRAIRASSSLP